MPSRAEVQKWWAARKTTVVLTGSGVVLVFTVWGLLILTDLFSKPWSVIPPIAAGLFVVLRLLAYFTENAVLRFLSRWIGAIAVPILTLLAVDAAWADTIDSRPAPLIGLAFAGLVIGFAVWVYLQSWWTADRSERALFWAAFFVGLLVIAPPMLAWAWGEVHDAAKGVRIAFGLILVGVAVGVYLQRAKHRDGSPRSKRWRMAWAGGAVAVTAVALAWVWGELNEPDRLPGQQAVSRLDVVTINGGPGEVAPATVSHGWNIAYWNGRAGPGAEAVAWGVAGAPPAEGRARSDRVLVLLPDGAPSLRNRAELPDRPEEPGEVERWLALADQAVPADVPTFVLLETRDEERRARWRDKLTEPPAKPDGKRHGRVLSLHEEQGDLGDLVFRLASTSDSAEQDLALAARHRPALFFATGEVYDTPLNADRLLESGAMQMCANNQFGLELCTDVHSSEDLENANNHLRFKTDDLARATRDTTLYVHVRHARKHELVYLDYWWYLPDNPANAGDGALCGAGFAIAGITCHDHQSDWEGVTVIAKPGKGSEPSEPIAVNYSAHNGRTSYDWKTLTEVWQRLDTRNRRPFEPNVDTTLRPLVFVALGTHAGYPDICRTKKCDEHGLWRDNRHDGALAWVGNDDAARACEALCVAALPTRDGGRRPARWNAYDGTWGRAKCELVFFCNQADPPKSPGDQGRYEKPQCATRWAEWTGSDVRVHEEERCYPPAPKAAVSAPAGTPPPTP